MGLPCRVASETDFRDGVGEGWWWMVSDAMDDPTVGWSRRTEGSELVSRRRQRRYGCAGIQGRMQSAACVGVLGLWWMRAGVCSGACRSSRCRWMVSRAEWTVPSWGLVWRNGWKERVGCRWMVGSEEAGRQQAGSQVTETKRGGRHKEVQERWESGPLDGRRREGGEGGR